jgi:hypothetical protein
MKSLRQVQLLSPMIEQTTQTDIYRAIILKHYFEKYIDITGLFAGFQSFILTIDIIDHTEYVPTMLVLLSFLTNMMVFFVSCITYTSITGGMLESYYESANVVCSISILVSTLIYYASMVYSMYDLFQAIDYYDYINTVIFAVSVIMSTGVFLYYLKNVHSKLHTSFEDRIVRIRKLNQMA